MDERTLHYYDQRAAELASVFDGIRRPPEGKWLRAFPGGGRILDIGSGSGRDAAALVAEGYEAWGVEPSSGFRKLSVERHPELRARIVGGGLPDALPDPEDLGGPFDGILCTAVLQHVPRHRVIEAILEFKKVLKPGGRALVTVPRERPGLDAEFRDAGGRLFTPLGASELRLMFERAGFVLIESRTAEDVLGRPGHTWSILLLRLESAAGGRAIDRIEAVLGRDQKVATYKLALVRALAEIAVRRFHLAEEEEGRVAVPVRAVAELWLQYYWPLLESEEFLPQYQNDRGKGAHSFKFASPLKALIDAYALAGGLPAYLFDRRSGVIVPAARRHHDVALAKATAAIKEGPVKHAGATSVEGALFSARGDRILVHASLWRELSLLGHWIAEAVVLRWAEETVRLSGRSVGAGVVVEALLARGDPERDQLAARALFTGAAPLRCTWTDRSLTPGTMAIDHLIPFSLWGNNDLWNLLPVERSVNARKSDLLPTRSLLRARKEPIIHCWEVARERGSRRFENEVAAWTGRKRLPLDGLFDLVSESIEFTALQRGTGRWEP